MADLTFKDLDSQATVSDADIVPISNEATTFAYKVAMPTLKEYMTTDLASVITSSDFSPGTGTITWDGGGDDIYTFSDLAQFNELDIGDIIYVPENHLVFYSKDGLAEGKARLSNAIGWTNTAFEFAKAPLATRNFIGNVTAYLSNREISSETIRASQIIPNNTDYLILATNSYNANQSSNIKLEKGTGSGKILTVSQGIDPVMDINANGVVSLPKQSGMVASGLAINLLCDNQFNLLIPTVTDYESVGEYNDSTGEFTPAVSGIYMACVACAGVITVAAGTTAIDPRLTVYINNFPTSFKEFTHTEVGTFTALSQLNINAHVSSVGKLTGGTPYKGMVRPYCPFSSISVLNGTASVSFMRIA